MTYEARVRAGNTSCYSWGNFIAGISSDSVTPYQHDTDIKTRVWQESIDGTAWTDNPRLTVKCDRFPPQSKRHCFTVGLLSVRSA